MLDYTHKYMYNKYMTSKELIKLIEKDGWFMVSSRGSHRKYKHLIKEGVVIVPFHNFDIPKGTLNSILKQADIKVGI